MRLAVTALSVACRVVLIVIFEEMTRDICVDRAVVVVYMDFRQAFNKVLRVSVIQLIKVYRIHDDLIVCIRNCVIGRRESAGWNVAIPAGALLQVKYHTTI